MYLFFKDDQSLEQLLGEMNHLSQEFRLWAESLLKIGWLEKIVGILISAGKAPDKRGAINYLNQLSSGQKTDLKIAKNDFNGETSREPFRILERKLGINGQSDLNLFRHFGIVGHRAINKLVSGAIPDYRHTANLFNQRREQHRQLRIFETAASHQFQPTLFNSQELDPAVIFWKEILPGNKISHKLKKEIKEIWEMLAGLSQGHTNWMNLYTAVYRFIPELEARLTPIFQPHLRDLKTYDVYTRYLKWLTMMSWTTLFFWAEQNQTPLFKEVPVFSSQLGIGGGRIDAIDVLSINGQAPSKIQKEIINKLTGDSYASIGHLVDALRRIFGHRLKLRITDWKFTVGDGVNNGQVIQPEELAEPFPKHALQIKTYLTLANLDCYLQNQNGRHPWHDQAYFSKVRLVYILPLSEPVVHEFDVPVPEQRKLFQDEFVTKLHLAEKQAVLRTLNNLLVSHASSLLDGKGEATPTKRYPKKTELFPEWGARKRIKRIIDKHRRFLDKQRIIEVVKRNKEGDDLLIMHLDRLAKAEVQFGSFNWETGGFISCLAHLEQTPSMRVNIEDGFFKCFGCGIFGFLMPLKAERPVFAKVQFRSNGQIFKTPDLQKISQVIIPEGHHQIMTLAQQTLQERFRRSSGQPYVLERGIDPDLAQSLGAGYGDDFLIFSLLESYPLDDLIYYGFVAVSDRISPGRGLCPVLSKKGMSLLQMRRRVSDKKMGLPYSTLDKRVTFPLFFEERCTGFYGRATWPDCSSRSKHRKLSTKRTKVPQGLFNHQPLQSPAKEIILTEGVFDGLSLIQLGWKETVSIIGVGNRLCLEYLARSKKDIAIAFDQDSNQTGQTRTLKIIEHLQKIKYQKTVRNFTENFVAQNPEFNHWQCKDFNDYLMKKTQTA